MSDLPDYQREIVIVSSVTLDVTGSVTISATADVNLVQVGGVTLATPTVAACVPVSIENDAIAYDVTNDRFKVDVEKWSSTDTVDVNVTNASLTVVVSGTVTVSGTVAVSGTVTVSGTVAISGTVTVSGTVAATQSGTWNIGTVTTITNTVTVSGSVTVSGTVAATQSGTWNIGTVTTITNTVTVSGSVTVSGTVAATQSGTWNIGTVTTITNTVTVSGSVTVSGTVLTDIETNTDNLIKTATTPAIYNVTLTNANTEYSQALPANTRKFLVQCRDGTAFRLAFVTGKVATPTEPYLTVVTDGIYYEDNVLSSATIYVAGGVAGKVIEILAWT